MGRGGGKDCSACSLFPRYMITSDLDWDNIYTVSGISYMYNFGLLSCSSSWGHASVTTAMTQSTIMTLNLCQEYKTEADEPSCRHTA